MRLCAMNNISYKDSPNRKTLFTSYRIHKKIIFTVQISFIMEVMNKKSLKN